MVLALGIALTAAGSVALDHWPQEAPLPLETVRFDGDLNRVQEGDLREALADQLDGGLLGVDVGGVRRAVESLAWVESAAVRRVWPDTLRITVTEQTPVAQWGGAALMNAEAQVFRPRTLPEGLPSLSGPPGSAARVLAKYQRLRIDLAPLGLTPSGLTLDERRAWTVSLKDGGTLRLGREETEARMARLINAWPRMKQAQSRSVAVVDLRYPNGFALRWQDEE